MIIGIPKEIKNNEYRLACTPAGVKEIVRNGHRVLVEIDAGLASGYSNMDYELAGAIMVKSPEEIYLKSDLIYKVKEIFPQEFKYLREDLIIFTYIHSNSNEKQTDALLESKVIAIAYEDIDDEDGEFPLLKPMSIIAGKGGILAALNCLQRIYGGRGILLGRIDGVASPEITIIGAGHSGLAAAEMGAVLGNKVSLLDIDMKKLEAARKTLPLNVELLYSNKDNLDMCLRRTDVVINCILWPKWREDHLVTREMLGIMKENSLIIDVSCDEAGAIETSRATSHDKPTYVVDGITHYCVDNIPSAFSQTATIALCNASLPYLLEISNKGIERALIENPHLRRGLTSYKGKLTLEETARKQKRPYISPEKALGI